MGVTFLDICRPGPFCGGVPELRANYSRGAGAYFIFVKCTVCGGQGKTYTEKDDPEKKGFSTLACAKAVTAWNKRTREETEIERISNSGAESV